MKKLLISLTFCLISALSFAQDSDFVRAKKTLDQIDNGLSYLKQGDVKAYNALSAKLADARKLLESTGSKNDPEYNTLVNRWNADQQKLIQIADDWKRQTVTANTQESKPPAQQQAKPAPASKPAASTNTGNNLSSSQIYNGIIEKYQPQNRPALAEGADADQAVDWARKMQFLATDQIAQDTQTIESAFAAGQLNKNDKNKFDRWVKQTWQGQILQQIDQVKLGYEQRLAAGMEQANFINNADENDDNKILNIGGENHYPYKKDALQNGLLSLNTLVQLEQTLGASDTSLRNEQRSQLKTAEKKLELFKEKDAVLRKELAKQPKKKKISTSQKLWLSGNMIAEITQKGEVWINSNFVGTIEDNGKIWVNGNNVGSFEKDGKVWHNGNHVGTLTENGEVWKSGTQVGSISRDGKVWYGTSSETVEGPGDWRRAAIIYFFNFY